MPYKFHFDELPVFAPFTKDLEGEIYEKRSTRTARLATNLYDAPVEWLKKDAPCWVASGTKEWIDAVKSGNGDAYVIDGKRLNKDKGTYE